MQTLNMLETPRIRHYSPTGSENVLGADNQQAQPQSWAPQTTKEHLFGDGGIVGPSGDRKEKIGYGVIGLGLTWPATSTAGKVKAAHISSIV